MPPAIGRRPPNRLLKSAQLIGDYGENERAGAREICFFRRGRTHYARRRVCAYAGVHVRVYVRGRGSLYWSN